MITPAGEKTDIDTLVVGGGQAGVAMSEHLSALGVPHVVLERDRIAARWRTARWDSLVANGPAWHDRFPGLEFDGFDPDAFPGKERVADYFEAYAERFEAPIRTGVEVKKIERNARRPGFAIETSDGELEANRVVAATGPFQNPVIPPIAPADSDITQIHSTEYRNPGQLPEGAVLVVGAGSSGAPGMEPPPVVPPLSSLPPDEPPPVSRSSSSSSPPEGAPGMPPPSPVRTISDHLGRRTGPSRCCARSRCRPVGY